MLTVADPSSFGDTTSPKITFPFQTAFTRDPMANGRCVWIRNLRPDRIATRAGTAAVDGSTLTVICSSILLTHQHPDHRTKAHGWKSCYRSCFSGSSADSQAGDMPVSSARVKAKRSDVAVTGFGKGEISAGRPLIT